MGTNLQNNLIVQFQWDVTAASTSVAISNDIERDQVVVSSWSYAVIRNKNGSKIERVKGNASGWVFTFTKRWLDQSDSDVEVPALKKAWKTWQTMYITLLSSQIVDKQNDNTFVGTQTFNNINVNGDATFDKTIRVPVYANAAARDAAITSPTNGMIIYNTALWLNQQYINSAWSNVDTGATPNGDETTAGKFQWATLAQQATATETWSTGAKLVVMNKNLIKTPTGAGDENKIPVLWADGKIPNGFLPATLYQTLTLWENLTAADLCFHINNSGGKLYKYLWYKGTRVNTTGWTTSASSFTVDANAKVQAIWTDKFVMVYNTWNGSFDQVVAVVGTLSNQSITFGTPTNITGISNVLQSISICEIDTDKFVVIRKNSGSTTIDSNICTVSGTTITVWATQTPITTSGTFTSVDICKVDINKFAVSSNAATRQMVCATVSGTTATFWSVITPTITANSLVQVTANKVVATDGTNIRIYTISGTTITEQANFGIGTTYTAPTMCNYSTTSSYVLFSGTTWGNTEAFIVDCSGTTASKGTTLSVLVGTGNVMCAKSILDDVVVCSGTVNTHLSVTGTTLALRKAITLTDAVVWYKGMTYIGIRNIVSCLWSKTVNPWAWSHNNTIKFVAWVLQETGTTGQTKNVAMTWAASIVHTSLTPGNPLYASNSDWSYTTWVTDVFVGLTTSSTNVLVSIPYSTL